MTEERKSYYINLIKTSYSLREVCIKSNIVVTTGNYNTLKKIITENIVKLICSKTFIFLPPLILLFFLLYFENLYLHLVHVH